MSVRLDVEMVARGLCESRNRAAMLIKAGNVLVNGKPATKPATDAEGCEIELIGNLKYVSRAGLKLEAALEHFKVDVAGTVAVDIGASTGGFCQCLLEHGAQFVYAVDVGKGQLHNKLKSDNRVLDMSGTNARTLCAADFGRQIHVVTMDVSFISQSILYPVVSDILSDSGTFISLIKPQFEAGRQHIGKGGLVREIAGLYESIFERLKNEAMRFGLVLSDVMDSPIRGGDGNKEFLACFFKKDGLPQ